MVKRGLNWHLSQKVSDFLGWEVRFQGRKGLGHSGVCCNGPDSTIAKNRSSTACGAVRERMSVRPAAMPSKFCDTKMPKRLSDTWTARLPASLSQLIGCFGRGSKKAAPFPRPPNRIVFSFVMSFQSSRLYLSATLRTIGPSLETATIYLQPTKPQIRDWLFVASLQGAGAYPTPRKSNHQPLICQRRTIVTLPRLACPRRYRRESGHPFRKV